MPATESSELIGIIAAIVILTFTFGTLVATFLPIINAIIGLLCTLAIIRMLSNVTSVPSVAPTLATMIGLGVGIDYGLFIITRHFRGLSDGSESRSRSRAPLATSGGAVFFAGSTVTIALLSLLVANIPQVTAMGEMAAIAVVIAVLAALTLLPASLAHSDRTSTRFASARSTPRSARTRGSGRSGRMRSPSTQPGAARSHW